MNAYHIAWDQIIGEPTQEMRTAVYLGRPEDQWMFDVELKNGDVIEECYYVYDDDTVYNPDGVPIPPDDIQLLLFAAGELRYLIEVEMIEYLCEMDEYIKPQRTEEDIIWEGL